MSPYTFIKYVLCDWLKNVNENFLENSSFCGHLMRNAGRSELAGISATNLAGIKAEPSPSKKFFIHTSLS